jgi:DNA-binding phage protein
MAKTSTLSWDPQGTLRQKKTDMAAYLEAALEEGDSSLVTVVLRDIARAKRMTQQGRQSPARGRPFSSEH